MSSKYRHVLPNLGHFAGYVLKEEPYGMVIPLVDRVLVSRLVESEVEDEPDEMQDMIIGTVIMDRQYKEADDVGKNVRFMGYIDPIWIATKKSDLMKYEENLKAWGREWANRTTPVVVPAAVEELFGEPDFDDEEDSLPKPPRKRKGR